MAELKHSGAIVTRWNGQVTPRLTAVAELKQDEQYPWMREVTSHSTAHRRGRIEASASGVGDAAIMAVTPRLTAVAELKHHLHERGEGEQFLSLHGSPPWPN